LRPVSDQEATGKVREVFDDIKATKGVDFIPNFWQALAVNPDQPFQFLSPTTASTEYTPIPPP